SLNAPATANLVQVQSRAGGEMLFKNLSFYGQDTWRAQRRLSLTYGLRWDINPALSVVSGGTPVSLIGINNPSTLQLAPLGSKLYATTHGNFAPRFGIAYQLSTHPGRETIIRGGVGIFYDLGSGESSAVYSGYPFSITRTSANLLYPLSAGNAAAPA